MLSDDAYEFLRALDPNAKEFNFRTIREDGSSAWLNDEHHGSLDSVGYELESRNAHCCVSVQVNESSNRSFKGQDITRIRALWVDDDGKKEVGASAPLPPSLTVETSPGRYHRYWFVEGDWPADADGRKDFDNCMRGMVEKYGCDSQARDIGRLLRLPGTWNRKPGKNHLTKIIFKSDARYTRQTLVDAFAVEREPRSQAVVRAAFEDKAVDIADVQYALSRIPADDREIWVKVGMALKHAFREDGYEHWCEWSSKSEQYDPKEQHRTWKGLNNDKANPVTIASVFALASECEVEIDITSSELKTTLVDIPRREGDLTERTMAGLKIKFDEWNHHPSVEMMGGLCEAAKVIQGMADGKLRDQSFYISFSEPGIGKTSTVIEAVRNLTRMSEYDEVGVIILLSRLEEIRRLAEEMQLEKDEFSVICSPGRDEYLLGNQRKQQARVMFATQQMLETKLTKSDSFEACDYFFWNGKPRQVRIWDEAILPSKSLTAELSYIEDLVGTIRRQRAFELADKIKNFGIELSTKKDNDTIEVPDIKESTFELETMINWFDTNSPQAATIEALWNLAERTCRVRVHGRSAVLDYEDVLPLDFGPMLVCDASGKTREVYKLWQEHRKGVKRLQSGEKNYRGLTLNVWNEGAGRDALRDSSQKYIDAFVSAISTIPTDEAILVVVRKQENKKKDTDFIEEFKARLPDRSNIEFTTWGKHTATNEFKHCKHVMLVGVLNYSFAQTEAIGRGAMGADTDDEFKMRDHEAVRLGEIGHHIYQAACRGMVRMSEGDHCPEGTTLWVVCPTTGRFGFPPN